MKSLPHKTGLLFRVLMLSLGCLLLLSCGPQPQVQVPDTTVERTGSHALYVVSHGWHTGLILPLKCLESGLPGLMDGLAPQESGPGDWVEIGWGDAGFYQAQEITIGLALRAFFASSGAVLHVVRPEESAGMLSPWEYFAGSEVVELRISDQELESVSRFVALSFKRGAGDALLPLGKGLYGNSRFYEALGRYHGLHTCNTWTAKGLASAGIDIEPCTTLTASGVMRAARTSQQAVRRPHGSP